LRKLASAQLSKQPRNLALIAQARNEIVKLASARLSEQPRNLGMIAQARNKIVKGSNRKHAQPCKFAQPSQGCGNLKRKYTSASLVKK